MNNKCKIHHFILLDESGSMEAIKDMILEGLNETLLSIELFHKTFKNQEHFISMISFNSVGKKLHYWHDLIGKNKSLRPIDYKPTLGTPLFDALGSGIVQMSNELGPTDNYKVLVTIFTDGVDNASIEYDNISIKGMIEDYRKANWMFAYVGTGHDVSRIAGSMSITNVMTFDKNSESLRRVFAAQNLARYHYSDKVHNGESGDNHYKDDLNKTG